MKTSGFLPATLICFFVIVLQSILPAIRIQDNSLTPDLFLLLITYFALNHGRYLTIIIGFILGTLQDFTTQSGLLGVYGFVKSLSGFSLGTIYNYRVVWSKSVKYGFIFSCYIFHFMIYYYVVLTGTANSLAFGLKLILIHSIISIILIWIVDKFLFNSKLV